MSHFKKMDYQVDLASQIVESVRKNDITICSIPCGYGKSGIAYWIHTLFGGKSIILNHNRVLVDQYNELYGDMSDIVCLKGKTNYLCQLYKDKFNKEVSVENAPCQVRRKFRCAYKSSGKCEYYRLRSEFDEKSLAITNYQLLLTLLDIGAYSRPGNNLIICDECHNIDSILAEYRSVRINPQTLETATNLSNILGTLGVVEARDCNKVCRDAYNAMSEREYKRCYEIFYTHLMKLENYGSNIVEDDDGYLESQYGIGLVSKLNETLSTIHKMTCKWKNYVKTVDESPYVYQADKDVIEGQEIYSYSLIPIHIGKLFRDTYKQVSNRVVLMSGTVVGKDNLKRNLGIEEVSSGYFDVPSRFKVENRPVIFCNIASLNKDNIQSGHIEYDDVIDTIKNLLDYHSSKKESGVIFVPSYYLGKRVYESLRDEFLKLKYAVYMNEGSDDAMEVLKKFSDTSIEKRILISPSFEEGVNMPDDVSRFQIIVKTPYLYLGNKRVRAKMDIDREWYDIATFTRIIQSSARSVRNINDYAVTYVLDTNSYRLYQKIKKDCPEWFVESVSV